MEDYSRFKKIAREETLKVLQAERETMTAQINSITEKLNALESAFDNKNNNKGDTKDE